MFCLAFHAFLRIGEMTVQSANATNPNLLQWKQLEIKDKSLTVTFIHFKHSKGKPLTLTIKGTTSPQDCPLQIVKAYLTMRGATAGPLFLYCPSVPVTRAKFNEQLRGALQFCHFCPKQFKSHSFRIGAATTAAAQGMSDSQIRSLGRWSPDAFMKYIRCSHRVSAPSRALAWLIARSSEQEVRVGPKEKGHFLCVLFCQTIHVGMSCCCHFSYVPVFKMFFCRRVFACVGEWGWGVEGKQVGSML